MKRPRTALLVSGGEPPSPGWFWEHLPYIDERAEACAKRLGRADLSADVFLNSIARLARSTLRPELSRARTFISTLVHRASIDVIVRGRRRPRLVLRELGWLEERLIQNPPEAAEERVTRRRRPSLARLPKELWLAVLVFACIVVLRGLKLIPRSAP